MNHLVAKEKEACFGLNCCWDSRHTRTYSPGCNLPPLLTCSGGTLVYEHLNTTRVLKLVKAPPKSFSTLS